MKEKDKAMARNLRGTDISNMPDREFKVMIIKILNGLETRVAHMSETLNTQQR